MKQNKNCYDDVIEWSKKHNIHAGDDHVIIARYDHTIENLKYRLSISEVKDVISKKIANDTNYLKAIEIDAEKKKDAAPDDFVCSVCNSSICIADNGNVYPCAGWQGYIIGNIKENSLDEIWNNSKKAQFLRALRKHDFPKCIQCADKKFCTMCMVRNANESPTGDPLVVNEYFCEIARFNKIKVLERKKQHGNKHN